MLDIGTHLTALSLWAVTALPAYLCAARLAGRWFSPTDDVPAREWLGLLLGWCLLASLLGGVGLTGLAWVLLVGQWALAVRLATKRGWPRRAAVLTVLGGFAGFVGYALAGGLLLRQTGPLSTWGWWILLPLVWLLWLRLPTIPKPRPVEEPPA
jgi:hypothetical protein